MSHGKAFSYGLATLAAIGIIAYVQYDTQKKIEYIEHEFTNLEEITKDIKGKLTTEVEKQVALPTPQPEPERVISVKKIGGKNFEQEKTRGTAPYIKNF